MYFKNKYLCFTVRGADVRTPYLPSLSPSVMPLSRRGQAGRGAVTDAFNRVSSIEFRGQNIIQPLLGYVIGSTEGLNSLAFGPITYGQFITALIDFLLIAAVVYFIFKGLGFDKLDKKKE